MFIASFSVVEDRNDDFVQALLFNILGVQFVWLGSREKKRGNEINRIEERINLANNKTVPGIR